MLINEYKHIPEYRDKLVETFFSMVRWGSQVDLVLPLDDRFEFQLIWDDIMHVEAGTDRLVRVKRNQNIVSAFG